MPWWGVLLLTMTLVCLGGTILVTVINEILDD
jgi:hypothetical protein